MRKTIFVALLFLSFGTFAQLPTNPEIINYNYSTYSGPIMKGWLFTKSYYKFLYEKIQLKDSLITAQHKQDSLQTLALSVCDKEKLLLNQKIDIRDTLLAQDQVAIKGLSKSFEDEKIISSKKIAKSVHRKQMAVMGGGSFILGAIASMIAIISLFH